MTQNLRQAAKRLWQMYHCFNLPDAPQRGEIDEAWNHLKVELDRPEPMSAGRAAIIVLILSGLVWTLSLALLTFLWEVAR
jgi:hypothetical protein